MIIRREIGLFLMLMFSVGIYSQTESKRDSSFIDKQHPLYEFQDLRQSNNTSVSATETVENYKMEPEERRRREIFVQSLVFLHSEGYVGPSPHPDLVAGYKAGNILSFTNDYVFYDEHELTNDLSLTTLSSKETFPGLGGLNLISADLHYQPWDWLSLSGGVYAAKYNMVGAKGLMHFNDLGFNASMRFKLHDRVYIRAHGMYSINSNDKNRNFRPSMTGMYPQTYYGAGVEFKVTNKFGVEGGAVRELNPMNGKWQNRLYIMPIFYSTGRR